jgi:3',5'-cyclic-AMP phosphodiesterase
VLVRAGWLTDIHLNFVDATSRVAFYEELRGHEFDALLIGGDIGEAPSVARLLDEIAEALRIPIYFVLGNHDFYRGSLAAVRQAIAGISAGSPSTGDSWLHWLPARGVVPLTAATALIGHDSWADGRCGDFFRSEVELNDYYQIAELTGLDKSQRYARLNALGDEAAAFLEARLREAVAGWRNVIALTHVPPFRESCWHEGRISDGDWLPHFCCRAVGERLASVMREFPARRLTVLCGHTHGAGEARILDNLVVLTGGAEYGSPKLQQVLNVE